MIHSYKYNSYLCSSKNNIYINIGPINNYYSYLIEPYIIRKQKNIILRNNGKEFLIYEHHISLIDIGIESYLRDAGMDKKDVTILKDKKINIIHNKKTFAFKINYMIDLGIKLLMWRLNHRFKIIFFQETHHGFCVMRII